MGVKDKLPVFDQLVVDAFRRGVKVGADLERERLFRGMRNLQEGEKPVVAAFIDDLIARLERE
jgi:hypothetical protein